jgi:hypothetical protein
MNKENVMTQFATKFEEQKSQLRHQLDVASARLKLCLLYPYMDSGLSTFNPESEMTDSRRAEYQQAYDTYNDFLDAAIVNSISEQACVLN